MIPPAEKMGKKGGSNNSQGRSGWNVKGQHPHAPANYTAPTETPAFSNGVSALCLYVADPAPAL